MSTLTQLFTSIANAIRAKKGTSALIQAENFPTEIAGIETGELTEEQYNQAVTLTEQILGTDLPYIKLEYIQASGTQYINTGHKASQATKTEMLVETINLTGTFVPFGSRGYYSNDYIIGINYTSKNYIQYNTNTAIYTSDGSSSVLLNTLMTVSLDNTKGRITYNNTNIDMTPIDTGSFSCPVNLYLGCLNDNGTIKYAQAYKLYSCKIYDGATLIRDYIPVKRKSDNAICLYDKISEEFFTNAGSGVFTAGPVVVS